MKKEFYNLAEQYAECWSVGNGGKVEYVFSETGLLLFGLEIFEQNKLMDDALVEALIA
jgi:hypothetical protein